MDDTDTTNMDVVISGSGGNSDSETTTLVPRVSRIMWTDDIVYRLARRLPIVTALKLGIVNRHFAEVTKRVLKRRAKASRLIAKVVFRWWLRKIYTRLPTIDFQERTTFKSLFESHRKNLPKCVAITSLFVKLSLWDATTTNDTVGIQPNVQIPLRLVVNGSIVFSEVVLEATPNWQRVQFFDGGMPVYVDLMDVSIVCDSVKFQMRCAMHLIDETISAEHSGRIGVRMGLNRYNELFYQMTLAMPLFDRPVPIKGMLSYSRVFTGRSNVV